MVLLKGEGEGEPPNGEAEGVVLVSCLTGVAAVGAGLGGVEPPTSDDGEGGVVARSCERSSVVGGLGGKVLPNTEEPTPPNGLGDFAGTIGLSSALGSALGSSKGDGD